MKHAISYVKLKSLSWWMSFIPVVTGVFLSFEPVHGLADYVDVINSITGDVKPVILINAGLVGIGFRRAIS